MEEDKITNMSDQALDLYFNKYGDTTNIDIIKLAKLYGFKVYKSKDLSNISLAYLEVNKNKKRIVVNEEYKKEAQNYYIALELSNYLLYGNDNKYIDLLCEYSFNSGNAKLANEILMPYEDFINKYNSYKLEYIHYDKTIQILSKNYELPKSVINQRMQEVLIKKNKTKKRTK